MIRAWIDLSADWLAAQLHAAVSGFRVDRIGTGQEPCAHR
jgi:hypothetical protein